MTTDWVISKQSVGDNVPAQSSQRANDVVPMKFSTRLSSSLAFAVSPMILRGRLPPSAADANARSCSRISRVAWRPSQSGICGETIPARRRTTSGNSASRAINLCGVTG